MGVPSLAILAGLAATIIGPFAPAALAARVDWETRLGLGYDDNILREADSAENEGRYLPFDAKLKIRNALADGLLSEIKLNGWGSYYPHPNPDGGTQKMEARWKLDRPIRMTLPRGGRSKLTFELSAVLGRKNTTLYGRSLGEEFSVNLGDSVVGLGDRYDSRYRRVGGGLEWRLPRRWKLESKVQVTRRDYIEDFEDIPGIDKLDYDAWRWTLVVRKKFGRFLHTRLEGSRGRSDYDQWASRDFDGNPVVGRPQSLDYRGGLLGLRYRRKGLGVLNMALEKKTRRDPFMGYYDYDQESFLPQWRFDLPRNATISLAYEYSHRRYAKAHVGFNPIRALREDFERSLSLEIRWAWRPSIEFIIRYVYEDIDEANPAYTFTRSRIWTGFSLHS